MTTSVDAQLDSILKIVRRLADSQVVTQQRLDALQGFEAARDDAVASKHAAWERVVGANAEVACIEIKLRDALHGLAAAQLRYTDLLIRLRALAAGGPHVSSDVLREVAADEELGYRAIATTSEDCRPGPLRFCIVGGDLLPLTTRDEKQIVVGIVGANAGPAIEYVAVYEQRDNGSAYLVGTIEVCR